MEILPSMRCWTLAVHQSLMTACPQISRLLAKYFWKQLYTLCLVQLSQSSFHVLTISQLISSFTNPTTNCHDLNPSWLFSPFYFHDAFCSIIHKVQHSLDQNFRCEKGPPNNRGMDMHQTATLTNQCLQFCTKQIFHLGIIKCTTIITKFQRQWTVPISNFEKSRGTWLDSDMLL
jgi:hypothetical protein